MNKHIIRSGAGLVLAAASIAALAGCVSSSSHGSRVEFYSSTADLSDASTLVVSGTVTEQHVAQDIEGSGDFTLSTLHVADAPKDADGVDAGSDIVVRQLGSTANPGPAAFLEDGGTYLLYLTASGLDGDLASQYYVTGGEAGLYEEATQTAAKRSASTSDVSTFTKVPEGDEGGDTLPEQVTFEEAAG
ncbi:hypothetical protein [Curtobacterium sp. VKM Ac-1393]|uniref:hypothetical protein n=1 Tax=Curtobacterium sp. VKM Ac-1393 TaxID=2783814 RepID=UPI00188AA9CE|nr:hypothetical protein [Curtobacterium sp. VKM Ac-1393]MBF4609404.1 hypothetical protein [Curtobacterium sp. VKM Ac-1393]